MITPHTIIIAEAGVNHNGSLEMALELVDKAADAGADYVKFQTFKAEKLVSRNAQKAKYQQENTTDKDNTQLAMLKRLELSISEHLILIARCKERGISFLSTAFDMESIDFLHSLGLPLWKIPSGEITNLPYLRRIAGYGGKVIMSTGMSDINDVSNAVDVLVSGGINKSDIVLLHCNTQYPTPMSDVNLLAINELKKLGCGSVGYSDHTLGIEVPVAAVAMGATVIEKHFTLDKSLPGPDHRASLDPSELKAMVMAIRNIERALGSGSKHITKSESENVAVARKSIVAACDIKAGDVFTEENLTVKRPGTGISPMRWDEILGKTASKDFSVDSLIEI